MPPVASQYLRNTDLSPSETDRKQLSDSAGAGIISTTKANFSTSTTRRYLHLIPLTTTTATATPGNIGKGWKIDPDTMGATASANKIIPAGIWTFETSMVASTAQLANDTKLQAVVSKVNGTAATGTLLFTATSAAFALLVTNSDQSWTSSSQPEVTCGADDTIIVEIFVESIGVVVVGQTLTLHINAASGSSGDARTITPGDVVTEYFQSASASEVGVAARGNNTVKLTRSATGVGVATKQALTVRPAAKLATMVGVPAKLVYVKPGAALATMIGVATQQPRWIRLASKQAAAIGVAARQPNWIRLAAKSATAVGAAGFSRTLESFRSASAQMVGVPGFGRAIISVRQFVATMTGVPDGEVKIKFAILNRLEGGGTTIIKKLIAMFDD